MKVLLSISDTDIDSPGDCSEVDIETFNDLIEIMNKYNGSAAIMKLDGKINVIVNAGLLWDDEGSEK